jgi:hypothetical protein
MTNRRLLPVALLLLLALPLPGDTFARGGPLSTNNNDTCDVATLPAATLLLPYFEVDLDDFGGETTLFTVTNVADRAKVVRVTLWTDYGFPVLSFDVYLTGYDVQSINLRDVLASGQIGGPEGTGTAVSPVGDLSRTAGAGHDLTGCIEIPHLTPEMVARIQDAFLLGSYEVPGHQGRCVVGTAHANAIGYATMDVVRRCNGELPGLEYFEEDIRYDNVLMGEYQQLNPGASFAQGGPMVHIRAVGDNFPETFYGRLNVDDHPGERPSDQRQPLPSTFFARWISGGSSTYRTSFKIWRELAHRDLADECGITGDFTTVTEIVTFDENENAFTQATALRVDPPQPAQPEDLPAAALVSVTNPDVFPVPPNGAVAGWVYFNRDSRDPAAGRADQAWVVSSMRAEGRYSVDVDATALGNGCSPRTPRSEHLEGGTAPIGPAPNTTP